MTATAHAYVEDVNTQMLSYTSLRLYRGTTTDPNTAAFTTFVSNTTLVADTEHYDIVDSSATVNTLWRISYYHTGTTAESSLGPIIRAAGNAATTLRLLRMEAAQSANIGFNGLCSAAGTTTTLVDAVLRDSGVDTGFLEGAWIYRPDAAAAADKVRRVAKNGFTVASGTLAFDRAYTNLPASGEVYQVFGIYPPIDVAGVPWSWDRAARMGLEQMPFQDEINLGVGDGSTRRFSLAAHLNDIDEEDCGRVLLRTTDSNDVTWDVDANRNLRFWRFVANTPGVLAVELSTPPGSQQDVILEAQRCDSNVYIDTDTTLCPLKKAVAATVWALFDQATQHFPNRYAVELASATRNFIRAGGQLPVAVKGS